MLNKKDVRQIIVGKSPVALTTGAMDALNVGEVGAFTPSGVRVKASNVAAQDKIVLAKKRVGGEIQISDVIDKAEIMDLTAQAGIDDQESIDFIGYNGSTGDIDEIADNNYFVTVYIQAFYESESDGQYNKHIRANTNDTPVKKDIANQLVASANWNLGPQSKESEKYLKAELVSSGANTAVASGVVAINVVNGSKYFTATDTATLAAGEFIRFGTAMTDPVYEIVEIVNGTTGKLKSPYYGDTATLAFGAVRKVTATNFNAGNVGIKLSSLPLSFNVNRLGRSRFRKSIYTFTTANFGDTLITNVQSANKGRCAAETVAELEYFQQGFEFGGNHYQVGEPNIYGDFMSVDLTEDSYDVINLKFRHRLTGGFREDMSNKELQIFYPSSDEPAWLSTANNGLRDVLEAFGGLGATGLAT